MLELHQWIADKQSQQSVAAIFSDAWYLTYGCQCRSNKVEIDARHYERQKKVPEYVLSYYRRECRCTVH